VRRALPWLVAGLGVVLAAGGVAVFWTTNLAPSGGGGWFAYAPLVPGQAPPPGAPGQGWVVLWTGGHLAGAALLVAGSLVLSAVGGWLLGRRSARR
jgi:hypothetical protein